MEYSVSYFLSIVVVFILIVSIHEIGHLILAIIHGGKIGYLCLGYNREEYYNGKRKFIINIRGLSFLFSGYCHIPNFSALPSKSRWWIAIGGSLFNVTSAIISICISFNMTNPFIFYFFSFVSIANGISQILFFEDGKSMKRAKNEMKQAST